MKFSIQLDISHRNAHAIKKSLFTNCLKTSWTCRIEITQMISEHENAIFLYHQSKCNSGPVVQIIFETTKKYTWMQPNVSIVIPISQYFSVNCPWVEFYMWTLTFAKFFYCSLHKQCFLCRCKVQNEPTHVNIALLQAVCVNDLLLCIH